MAFSDWVLIGATGLFLHSAAKKNAAKREQEEAEYEEYMRDWEEQQRKDREDHEAYLKEMHEREVEWDRRRAVNQTRREMPCFFCDGISASDFSELAHHAAKQIKRIKSIDIRGAIVFGTVESQTGLSDWEFNVDFNNWGHIDGTYWTRSENDDSSIPKHYGSTLSSEVSAFLHNRTLSVVDFSDAVDDNKALGTPAGLSMSQRKSFIQRLFSGKADCINIAHDFTYFCGEHLYPVISLLKQYGFVNIQTIALNDTDENTSHYCYEVDSISISGASDFRYGYAFPSSSEIVIRYHSKRTISLSRSQCNFKRKNYIAVGDYLQGVGFTQIYEYPINDLTFGIITKVGSVEGVFIEAEDNCPFFPETEYSYDTKIIICYHARK